MIKGESGKMKYQVKTYNGKCFVNAAERETYGLALEYAKALAEEVATERTKEIECIFVITEGKALWIYPLFSVERNSEYV